MGKIKSRLITLMKQNRVTQETMAKTLGISIVSLNYKLNGVREFKANEMFLIKQCFFRSYSLEELFS